MRAQNSKAVREKVLARAKGVCEICGRRSQSLELHHVVPLAMAGSHSAANLKVVCPSCHRRISTAQREDIADITKSATEAYRFEQVVAGAFRRLGYAIIRDVTGPDAGIDLIARRQDPNSLERTSVIVECKSTSSPITTGHVRAFSAKCKQYFGSLGLIVVNRPPSPAALELAQRLGIKVSTVDELDAFFAALSGPNDG
jgi:predicted Mrr-cat superfamily restriction endonuclease